MIRNSLLGDVMLCARDVLALRKNVSGVQILSTMRLFKGKISTGPWKANLSSNHIWRKNISMVNSWETEPFLSVNHWYDHTTDISSSFEVSKLGVGETYISLTFLLIIFLASTLATSHEAQYALYINKTQENKFLEVGCCVFLPS